MVTPEVRDFGMALLPRAFEKRASEPTTSFPGLFPLNEVAEPSFNSSFNFEDLKIFKTLTRVMWL